MGFDVLRRCGYSKCAKCKSHMRILYGYLFYGWTVIKLRSQWPCSQPRLLEEKCDASGWFHCDVTQWAARMGLLFIWMSFDGSGGHRTSCSQLPYFFGLWKRSCGIIMSVSSVGWAWMNSLVTILGVTKSLGRLYMLGFNGQFWTNIQENIFIGFGFFKPLVL